MILSTYYIIRRLLGFPLDFYSSYSYYLESYYNLQGFGLY